MTIAGANASESASVGASAARWVKGCGVCRRTYDVSGWSALPAVATLPPTSVQAHLSVPAGFAVELRRCSCGAVLATRSG